MCLRETVSFRSILQNQTVESFQSTCMAKNEISAVVNVHFSFKNVCTRELYYTQIINFADLALESFPVNCFCQISRIINLLIYF